MLWWLDAIGGRAANAFDGFTAVLDGLCRLPFSKGVDLVLFLMYSGFMDVVRTHYHLAF